MAVRIHSTRLPRTGMKPRWRMRAADIPEVIALDSPRELLPYSMLVKEWE